MPSVNLCDVSISFGSKNILDTVNCSISGKERIALTGANGSGKTTLMKIISKILSPDHGKVVYEKNTRVSYLPQSEVFIQDITVFQEAEKSFNQEDIEVISYYAREKEIYKILTGLGFKKEEFQKRITNFSSGWQMRIALARVLLARPDILLLDEPTNYLDLEARQWLEKYLKSYKGAILVVSHDRSFLDATVNMIAEIYQKKLTLYYGNYTEYEKRRARELERTIELYRRQQEIISKTEMFIKRFRYNSARAKQVQNRIQYLEKLKRIERPPGIKTINFVFPHSQRSVELVLSVKNVNKFYGEKKVLDNISFELARGECLLLAGPNGAGKSTLIKILSKKLLLDSGQVKYGKNVTSGYFSQDNLDVFNESGTIIEEFESIVDSELIPNLRNLLGAFLFSGDDVYKNISVLSGGEKSRLLLLKLLLLPTNLLLLDEPTNHLDMMSKNILLDALNEFEGTIVFVSHDRYFIQNLATKVLELNEGKARYFYGDYDYYLYMKSKDEIVPLENKEKEEKSASALTRMKEKKRKSNLRKFKNEENLILGQLEELAEEIKTLESSMAKEDIYRDGEKMKEIKMKIIEKKIRQNELYKRWEEVEEKIKNQAGKKFNE